MKSLELIVKIRERAVFEDASKKSLRLGYLRWYLQLYPLKGHLDEVKGGKLVLAFLILQTSTRPVA